mgnify:FL=1|tara:strand:- start:2709 stop:4406 length:1698 start_codon:yes stop_codon:yes gene_type:complete
MAFVTYREKKIIPAPFISVQKQYVKSAGGTKIASHPDSASERRDNIIGAEFTIQISGTIVASMMGSPQIDGSLYSGGSYPPGKDLPQPEETIEPLNPTPPGPSEIDKQRFNRIMKMQQSLRWLFGKDGHFLEIDDGLGNEVFKCIVRRVESIEFSEANKGENWTDRCEYTISLVTDKIENSGHPLCPLGEDDEDHLDNLPKDENGDEIFLEEATETWAVEPQEEGSDGNSPYTFMVNHTVNAKGKRVYNGAGVVTSEAWKEAEKWVKTKIMSGGGDPQSITGSQQNIVTLGTTGLNLSGYTPYNRMRSENVDEMEGTYSITEAILLAKENTIENYSVAVRISQQTGLTTISLDGSIRGLDDNSDELDMYNESNDPNIKYTNALAKHASIGKLARAQAVATLLTPSVTLNPIAISSSITHDKVGGNVQYGTEYNNRPSACIAGARSENINVQFSGGEDVFAVIAVIGRSNGPVMQDMNTVKTGKVSISIDAVMPVVLYDDGCSEVTDSVCGLKPGTTGLIESLRDEAIVCHPSGTGSDTFKESDSESWNVISGRYTRNVTYVIKTC